MSSSAPPSDAARLAFFLDLVQDYRVLADVLPVQEKFTIGSIGPRNPTDHWHRLLRAFALRKFVSAGDQVTVVRVVQSPDSLMPERNEQIRSEMQELVAQATRGVGAFGTARPAHTTAPTTSLSMLYTAATSTATTTSGHAPECGPNCKRSWPSGHG